MSRWDWDEQARRAGMTREGILNAGALALPETCLIWHREDGSVGRISGADLQRLAEEIAGALRRAGARRGDRVAGIMGRRPEAFALPLGVWRLGAIFVPLFSGFGLESLRVRLEDSGTSVVVADAANLPGVANAREDLDEITVIAVDGDEESADHSLGTLVEQSIAVESVASTHHQDPATIMYTSGTSGAPKGCVIPHHGVLSLWPYVRHCLATGPGSVLFSTADTGWSFGLYTTGLAPMALGATRLLYEGGFDPHAWWEAMRTHEVTDFAGAPTAYRQLALAGPESLGDMPGGLQTATSAGEPLDPEVIRWFQSTYDLTIYDSYGLTELGMVVANQRGPGAGSPEPGSMGFALPGFEVALVSEDGEHLQGEASGRLAVRDNGYLLGSTYWGREDEWDRRVQDGWWVTEDIASRDADGRYWYVGRADDVIVTAGYNVGPFEVERALGEHPLVREAACVPEPDPRKGQIVSAYVVLDDGERPADLLEELRPWVGERVGWHAAPRRVTEVEELPRTESGKVRRSSLREGAGR